MYLGSQQYKKILPSAVLRSTQLALLKNDRKLSSIAPAALGSYVMGSRSGSRSIEDKKLKEAS
jgi:hypothetical protein